MTDAPEDIDWCARGAHAWQLVPVAQAEDPLAECKCCGVKAVFRFGEWVLLGEDDAPGRPG
jgi:hypothetical protein